MRGNRKRQIIIPFVIFWAALVGVSIFTLRGDHLTKEQIFALVENHQAQLTEIARSGELQAAEKPRGVQKIRQVDPVIDFYCGGAGMGSSTAYYGFYYSPDDVPDAVFCGTRFGLAADLHSDGEGFSLQREGNVYYTQKIAACFYYYEIHF